MAFKLSPSDLTFLYEGCKRCFYLKVIQRISPPSIPLPAIFSKIAGLLKEYYDGKRTEELHPNLPPGVVRYGEKWVESRIINFPNHENGCYIKGRFDIVIEFDDGTYGVYDFKTGNPEGEGTSLYSRQLHSYAYALEYPAPGAINLSPVSKLGLLYFYPTRVSQRTVDWLSFDAQIQLVEIKKNESEFLSFIEEVLEYLELDEVPLHTENCQWCNYIEAIDNYFGI